VSGRRSANCGALRDERCSSEGRALRPRPSHSSYLAREPKRRSVHSVLPQGVQPKFRFAHQRIGGPVHGLEHVCARLVAAAQHDHWVFGLNSASRDSDISPAFKPSGVLSRLWFRIVGAPLGK
jgi:hypothetical protein